MMSTKVVLLSFYLSIIFIFLSVVWQKKMKIKVPIKSKPKEAHCKGFVEREG